ncbi:LysR family transcriptional regulator [Variovorax ginsengisoli]|jgi:DNA-binding transcriptional LysR family regulator|uniref:LysR family transcriptional regulator n=1 Tax=Variovorax ginsengisoli TaxID=363844 RepID=A0ABT8S5Q0_9BURK|nr:LysR family transcriptional regulator [Variovorax ginsengisoli]MDN8614444.1 LysR family transcriptional regulator [Variovorax ginsengisoli]MDO1533614.1 LysR family transcriptional regulator [Variovorax ginsengisoli]
MRSQRIDLNLLIALDALLSESNVTRAAERVHLTQSAMSGVLARLRDYFEDPLLVPMGRSMQLTPRAESLAEPVRKILLQVDATLGVKPEFEPATAERHFRVIASDYVTQVLLAEVLRRIAQMAPRLSFDVRPTHSGMAQDLDQGRADFLVTPAHLTLPEHPQAILFDDTYHVIACQQNVDLRDGLTLEQYRSLGHVVYQAEQGDNPWFEQWYANQHGNTRRVEVVAHGFLLIPRFVVGTRRIATVQTRLAKQFVQSMPLALFEPPLETPRLTEVLQWHRYREDDPGVRWVREQIVALAEVMPAI